MLSSLFYSEMLKMQDCNKKVAEKFVYLQLICYLCIVQ